MKTASQIILLIAIALISYGYWGAFTEGGNKMYDEMDAYYPFFMLIFGGMLLITSIILSAIVRRKDKRQ